jgi:hypothetical protein
MDQQRGGGEGEADIFHTWMKSLRMAMESGGDRVMEWEGDERGGPHTTVVETSVSLFR